MDHSFSTAIRGPTPLPGPSPAKPESLVTLGLSSEYEARLLYQLHMVTHTWAQPGLDHLQILAPVPGALSGLCPDALGGTQRVPAPLNPNNFWLPAQAPGARSGLSASHTWWPKAEPSHAQIIPSSQPQSWVHSQSLCQPHVVSQSRAWPSPDHLQILAQVLCSRPRLHASHTTAHSGGPGSQPKSQTQGQVSMPATCFRKQQGLTLP